ncbi:hypothetical protein [Arenibacter palladensis]|uniref:hypothetical protein n=1 Tax=Arenibacter palladensis TaxID=237373 RepID=UPI002FD18D56
MYTTKSRQRKIGWEYKYSDRRLAPRMNELIKKNEIVGIIANANKKWMYLYQKISVGQGCGFF